MRSGVEWQSQLRSGEGTSEADDVANIDHESRHTGNHSEENEEVIE